MIFDGFDKFKNSCVEYVKFRFYPLRERFAKLRQQEEILQNYISDIKKTNPDEYFKLHKTITNPDVYGWIRAIFFLEFTESELCWMAHNIANEYKDDSESAPAKGKRRRASKKAKEPYVSKQIPIWDAMQLEVFD